MVPSRSACSRNREMAASSATTWHSHDAPIPDSNLAAAASSVALPSRPTGAEVKKAWVPFE